MSATMNPTLRDSLAGMKLEDKTLDADRRRLMPLVSLINGGNNGD